MKNEHGSYHITTLPNNIIVVDAIGPWNIELIERYHNDIIAKVKSFSGQPWRHIAILRNETLFIPEVSAFLDKHVSWRKANNALSETVVLTDSLSAVFSKQQYKTMFEPKGMKLYFAESLEQALGQIAQL